MTIFIKLGKVRSISIEWRHDYSFWPLYKRTSYRCETILDMPYTQIIFTSGKWTPLRRAANDQQKTKKTAGHFTGTDDH
jgi:hypothetical protein